MATANFPSIGQGGAGTGSAQLKGGSGNTSPAKTPVEYRDATEANWWSWTLYAQAT